MGKAKSRHTGGRIVAEAATNDIKGKNHAAEKILERDRENEQCQYEHIKEKAQKEGRYGRRAKEVAARTVMKQHKKKGTRKAK